MKSFIQAGCLACGCAVVVYLCYGWYTSSEQSTSKDSDTTVLSVSLNTHTDPLNLKENAPPSLGANTTQVLEVSQRNTGVPVKPATGTLNVQPAVAHSVEVNTTQVPGSKLHTGVPVQPAPDHVPMIQETNPITQPSLEAKKSQAAPVVRVFGADSYSASGSKKDASVVPPTARNPPLVPKREEKVLPQPPQNKIVFQQTGVPRQASPVVPRTSYYPEAAPRTSVHSSHASAAKLKASVVLGTGANPSPVPKSAGSQTQANSNLVYKLSNKFLMESGNGKLPESVIRPQAGDLNPFKIFALKDGKRFILNVLDGTDFTLADMLDNGSSFTYDNQDGLSLAFEKAPGLYLDNSEKLMKESTNIPANVKAFIEYTGSKSKTFFVKLKKEGEESEYFLSSYRDEEAKLILSATQRVVDAQEFFAEYVPYDKVSVQDYIQFRLLYGAGHKVIDSSTYVKDKNLVSAQDSAWIVADGQLRPASSPNLVLTAFKENGARYVEFQHRKLDRSKIIQDQNFTLDFKTGETGEPGELFISITLSGDKYFLGCKNQRLVLEKAKGYDDPYKSPLFRLKISSLKAVSKVQLKAITRGKENLSEGFIIPQPGELRPFKLIALDNGQMYSFVVRQSSSQPTDDLKGVSSFTYDEHDGLSLAFQNCLGLYLDNNGMLMRESRGHLSNVKAFIESGEDSFFIVLKKEGDGGDQFLKFAEIDGGEYLVSTERLEEAQEFRAEFVPYDEFTHPDNIKFCLAQEGRVLHSSSFIPRPKRLGLDQESEWILADGCFRPVSSPNLVLTAVKEDDIWYVEFQDRKVSIEGNDLIPEQRFEYEVRPEGTFIYIRLDSKRHFLYLDLSSLKLSSMWQNPYIHSFCCFKFSNPIAISNDQFRALHPVGL